MMTLDNLSETEEGNTYLINDLGQMILWIGLNVSEDDSEASQLLEIVVDSEDVPNIVVQTVYSYMSELKDEIQDQHAGWKVKSWNLPFDAPMDERNSIVGKED